jgi:hypothetical protein
VKIVMSPETELLKGGVEFFLLACLYFLPSFVGHRKRQANSISLANFFFGWTVIGWIVCLIWAASPDKKAGA